MSDKNVHLFACSLSSVFEVLTLLFMLYNKIWSRDPFDMLSRSKGESEGESKKGKNGRKEEGEQKKKVKGGDSSGS